MQLVAAHTIRPDARFVQGARIEIEALPVKQVDHLSALGQPEGDRAHQADEHLVVVMPMGTVPVTGTIGPGVAARIIDDPRRDALGPERLAEGGLGQPTTVILLVGFVWIWLVLIILAGVVQAWTSAWWNAVLDAGSGIESMEGDR